MPGDMATNTISVSAGVKSFSGRAPARLTCRFPALDFCELFRENSTRPHSRDTHGIVDGGFPSTIGLN